MNVLVVESPAKAKTINKYLGDNYKVLASFGHIRDLPSKDGSVKPDQDLAMLWDVDARAQSKITDIAKAVKGADKLILATDPDREGEAISWHILEVLREKGLLKMPVERVEALRVSDIFRAKVIDTTHESFIFEVTGAPTKIDKFVELMRPLGLVEHSRTGVLSITRGADDR